MVGWRAIFASGSHSRHWNWRAQIHPGTGQQRLHLPAMGMAVLATEAARVTEEMFIVAAKASPSR